MQEDYKRFVRVQGAGQYADYDVPTKEEYEDFQQRIAKQLDRLESRIATIEKTTLGEEESEVYTRGWIVPPYGGIEVTGTSKQFEAFVEKQEELRKEFSSRLDGNDVVLLALNCGLSISK